MLKRLMTITGLLFLASAVWASDMDKSTSYSVEKDGRTGIWTYNCNATIKGIDRNGIYNGNVFYETDAGDRISIQFVLDQNNRMYEESSEGMYEFQGRLTGQSFIIQLLFFAPEPLGSNCSFALGPGPDIGLGGLLSSHMTILAIEPPP